MKPIPDSDLVCPDSETHMLERRKDGKSCVWQNYQHDRLEAAYKHVKFWDVAVDVGAHIGLMSRALAERFKAVYAFEPAPEAFECLAANTKHLPNVLCVNSALGSKTGKIGIERVSGNTGDRQVIPDGEGVSLRALDDFLDLPACDLMKIDVQGYESEVLAGARATILAFAPVLIVEEEPQKKLRTIFAKEGQVRRLMDGWDGKCIAKVGADNIYVFGEDGARPYTKYAHRGDYHWTVAKEGKKAVVATVVAYVNTCGFSRVLDIGCGDGIYTSLIANAVGVDNNATAIDLARTHHVDAHHMSAYRIHTLGRFDAVLLFDALEHMTRQELLLSRISQITDNLLILNPDPNQSDWHYREFTTDELVAFVTGLGQGWVLKGIPIPSNKPNQRGKALLHFIKG